MLKPLSEKRLRAGLDELTAALPAEQPDLTPDNITEIMLRPDTIRVRYKNCHATLITVDSESDLRNAVERVSAKWYGGDVEDVICLDVLRTQTTPIYRVKLRTPFINPETDEFFTEVRIGCILL